jgi:hypothetical protein
MLLLRSGNLHGLSVFKKIHVHNESFSDSDLLTELILNKIQLMKTLAIGYSTVQFSLL